MQSPRVSARPPHDRCRPGACAALAVLAAVASPQGVRIVSPSGGGDFAQISAAVAAAGDGDVLLVASGTYAPFTVDGVELAIVAVPGADVRVAGSIAVRNVPAGRRVLLSGIDASGLASGSQALLTLEDCAGYVRLQDCEVLGGALGLDVDCDPADGGAGAAVRDCAAVAFVDCRLRGTAGEYQDAVGGNCDAGAGGAGLASLRSEIALYDCEAIGAPGGHADLYGGAGGAGFTTNESLVFASGTTLRGGDGGLALYAPPGPGGDALRVDAASAFHALDGALAGGAGSPPGQAVTGGGLYDPLPGSARTLQASAVVPDGRALTVTALGDSGDVVRLPSSTAPGQLLLLGAHGVCLLPCPPPPTAPAGTVGPGGALTARVRLPSLPPQVAVAVHAVQGIFGTPAGERYVGSARHALVLSPTVGPDCDGDGISDYAAVALGLVPDANANLIPDGCEP